MKDDEDYSNRVAAAVMKAIFEASLIEIDGVSASYIRTTAASEALTTAMAAMLEGAPHCVTPEAMKRSSEQVGHNLLTMMLEVRRIRQETGRTAFNATIVTLN